MDKESLEDRVVRDYVDAMMKRLTEVRLHDIGNVRYILDCSVRFEDPKPELRVAVNVVGNKYTISVSGFNSPKFDVIRWCTIFVSSKRDPRMRRVDGLFVQFTQKYAIHMIQMEASSSSSEEKSGPGGGGRRSKNSVQGRARALDFVRDFMQNQCGDIVAVEDVSYIEATLLEAMTFEDLADGPIPLRPSILFLNGSYNVMIAGYRHAVDLVRWCNIFVGEHRKDMLSHVDHLFIQDTDDGPVMLIQVQSISMHHLSEHAPAYVVRNIDDFCETDDSIFGGGMEGRRIVPPQNK